MNMNAREYLDMVLGLCAKLEEHPTYLGFVKTQLADASGLLQRAVDRVEELVEAEEKDE